MLDYIITTIFGAFIGWYFTKKVIIPSQKVKVITEKSDEDYINALNAIVNEDIDKAQKLLMETIDKDPDNVMAYQRLGELKYKQGNYTKALKIFEIISLRGVVLEDELIQAQKWFGKAAEKLGKIDQAIKSYDKVLEINSSDLEAVQALIILYGKNKDWDSTLKFIKKAENISGKSNNSNIAYILSCKAEDYFNKGNLKSAQKEAQEAIEKDEFCIPAYIILGDIFNKNNVKNAIDKWEEIVKVKPDLAFLVFRRLERAYFENNEYEKMISVYENILKVSPRSSITRSELGNLYFNMGNYNSAIQEYKDSIASGYITKEVGQNIFKIFKEQNKLPDFFNEIEVIFEKIEKDYKHICKTCQYTQNDFFWKCPKCNKMIYE